MQKYVIDSVVLIAAFNPRDQYNQKAMPLVKKVDDGVIGQVIITDYIFDEILTFIKAKAGHKKAVTVMNAILSSSYIPIKKISEEMFNSAIILFEMYEKLSFTDATTVAYMHSEDISTILSFDADFDAVKNIIRLEQL